MNEELITDNEIKTAQYHRGQYELRNNIYPEMLKDGETAPSRDDLNQYGVRVVYFTDGNRKSFVTSNINHDNAIIHINKNLSESEKKLTNGQRVRIYCYSLGLEYQKWIEI